MSRNNHEQVRLLLNWTGGVQYLELHSLTLIVDQTSILNPLKQNNYGWFAAKQMVDGWLFGPSWKGGFVDRELHSDDYWMISLGL